MLCIAFTLHSVSSDEASRTSEFRRRIQATAALGSKLVDKDMLQRLWQQASSLTSDTAEPSEALVQQVHASADYRHVYRQLNEIRNTDKDLIKYVYVLRDGKLPRFLADADVLNTTPPPREQLSYFGRTFTNASIEQLSASLRACEPHLERDFVPDPEYGVRSLSAYAPIHARDGACLGILGVDMADVDMRKTIAAARRRAWLHCGLTLGVMLLACVVIARSVQKPWSRLAKRLSRLVGRPTDNVPRSFHQRLDADVDYLERSLETPTESIQRQASDAIVKLYGGPSTAARVHHDVVPEHVHATVPADAELERYEIAHCLVAKISGLSKTPKDSTQASIRAVNELQQRFVALAKGRALHVAVTTGDSMIAIGAESIDAVLSVATELVAAAKAIAEASGLPITAVMGIDTGSVVVRRNKTSLVDAWGEPLINASALGGGAPAGRILLTAAAQKHNKTVFCRSHRHADDGRAEVFIVSSRNSQNRITKEN